MDLLSSPSKAVGTPQSLRKPSSNALKRGIFTNALMPGEDAQALDEVVNDLLEHFEIEDACSEICARRFVQTTMQTKRLHEAQLAYVEGYMQSEQAKVDFCKKVGINVAHAYELPTWFFSTDEDSRSRARFWLMVCIETKKLKDEYTVDKMTQAKTLYPNLWLSVMGKEGSATQKVYTIGERLGVTFNKQTPCENLQAYLDYLEESHEWMLFWARDEDRHELIIQGLRAQAVLEAVSNPNWSRAEGLFHRRSQELMQTMISLAVHARGKLEVLPNQLEVIAPKRKSAHKRAGKPQARKKVTKFAPAQEVIQAQEVHAADSEQSDQSHQDNQSAPSA